MSTFKNLTGLRFGRLTAQKLAARNQRGQAQWQCICDCGKVTTVAGYSLSGGGTKSCGCFRDDMIGALNRTHGRPSNDPTLISWRSMRRRCRDANYDYGGRYLGSGIAVCERWEVFANFVADMGERPHGKTIDRRDNSIGYEPGNCRWADRAEQAINRRSTIFVSLNGATKCLSHWCKSIGVSYSSVREKTQRGMEVTAALMYFAAKQGKTL